MSISFHHLFSISYKHASHAATLLVHHGPDYWEWVGERACQRFVVCLEGILVYSFIHK